MSSGRQNGVSQTYIYETYDRLNARGRVDVACYLTARPLCPCVAHAPVHVTSGRRPVRSLWAGGPDRGAATTGRYGAQEGAHDKYVRPAASAQSVSTSTYMGWGGSTPATAAVLRWLPVPRRPGRRTRRQRACRPQIGVAHHTPAGRARASGAFSSNP